MGGNAEIDPVSDILERRREILMEDMFAKGSKRKCTCGHNGYEHVTEPIDPDELRELDVDDKEAWNKFWSMPTRCIYCGCGNPDTQTDWWNQHRNCPKPCGCKDFTT